MADLILIKGGNGAVPDLQDRELAYSKDEKALYIGTDKGNVKLCDSDDAGKDSVFYAIYGETSASEITEAYKAGKTIACKSKNDIDGTTYIFRLTDVTEYAQVYGFTSGIVYDSMEGYPKIFNCDVSSAGWLMRTFKLATQE